MKKTTAAISQISLIASVVTSILCTLAQPAWPAENPITPNWNINSIGSQTRKLTHDYSGTGAVIGAGSIAGNASNNTLEIINATVSVDDDPITAWSQGTNVVIGGVGTNKTVSNNTLSISDSTIRGRDVLGGAALLDTVDHRLDAGTANSNKVQIINSDVISVMGFGGDVLGGYASYLEGSASNNTVILDHSSARTVYGGYTEDVLLEDVDYEVDEEGHVTYFVQWDYKADNNKVHILNGSQVDTVYGSYGPTSSFGNEIVISGDSTRVETVYGVVEGRGYATGEAESATSFNNNTVRIADGASVGAVWVVEGSSDNAMGNSLIVDNASISGGNGYLYTIYDTMSVTADGGAPVHATISGNMFALTNINTSLSLSEIGAGLNWAGPATSHELLLSNLTGGVTVNRSDLFNMSNATRGRASLDLNALEAKKLLYVKYYNGNVIDSPHFAAPYGFVYSGGGLDYVTQTNDTTTVPVVDADGNLPDWATTVPDEVEWADGGNTSDGNIVYIQNSNVNANIMGGLAFQIHDIDYATWEYTPASGEGADYKPAKYTKTVTQKIGNKVYVKKYDCGPDGTSCPSTPTSTEDPTELDEHADEVFSASNNTIILEDSNFDGTMYGGFVAGADLKVKNVSTSNNRVVLRGAAMLSDDAVLYGGNAYLGRSTNTLIFDHVAAADGGFITYAKKDQFQNFNDVWQINANLDTRINFDFNNVQAQVNLDAGFAGEGAATIIKTQTATDLSDVEQNGVIVDLTDSSVELTQKRSGVYTYGLTPTKEDATTVGWVLSSVKDKQNAEIYGQLPIVGLALAGEGAELLSRVYEEAWLSDQEQDVFINGAYHKTRYTTGSGFDLKSGLAQVGLWKKFTPFWMAGLFAKYSNGHYDTFPIKASGEGNVYGGGVMTSVYLTEVTRLEANVEVGYMELKFDSNDLNSTLKSRGSYYGAMAGLVQDFFDNWDGYANLQYLRKGTDSLSDNLDQKIKYDTMQSLVLRVGTDYTLLSNWGGLVPSFGVSGLYEFDGKSKVKVLDVSNNEASLKGLSGRAQMNLSYKNVDNILPLISQLTVFGQVGKRRGFGAEVNLSIAF